MSLHCLAILGNKNEPLYICAAGPIESGGNNNSEEERTKDVFGFFEDNDDHDASKPEASNSGYTKRQASIRHEMMIHSAIDRIEELLGSHRQITWKRFQRGSHWIGQICPMEEYDIYGYVTSSDVKIIALLERDGIVPLKKRKEVDIKIMFVSQACLF
mmetsp:Transcript_14428/g.29944  ORF Transcript_14428/g.29944 Transcript_14428/m.29944 type:complete len:158 (-) Transcript_14428:15-488(-)